jgi:23S rRNA pseudouridine2604 synthase
MAERGLCSRREADEYIAQGLVFVDGEKVQTLGVKFSPEVKIVLAKAAQEKQNNLITVLLNKPIGYVSAQPEKDYEPAIRLLTAENYFGEDTPNVIPQKLRDLACVGRLDIDSQGLLIFTQDGRIAKKIIGENTRVDKEYLVRVRGQLSKEDMQKLSNGGITLDGERLKPAKVEWINEDQLRFTLWEGKKRQIRRMCEVVNLEVLGLKRVRVGNVKLGKLPEGQWRFLDPNEIF